MNNTKNSILGIAWMLLFCLISIIADGIVRYVTIGGFSSSQILFIRSILGTLILLPIVIKDKSLFVSRKTLKLYIARGTFAFLGVASWFYILKYADFTALIAIGFTSPLFTSIFAIYFLGEKRTGIKIVALLIGFSGAMVVMEPFSITFNVYLLFAIGSAFFWAISLIFAKRLSDDQKPITVAFFVAAIITPLSLILALPTWQWPTQAEWIYILMFTGLATTAQISLAKSFSYAELTILMPIGYSELIFGAIFSYIVFGDLVTVNTLLGGAIILGSGYIIVRSERNKKHRQEELEVIP